MLWFLASTQRCSLVRNLPLIFFCRNGRLVFLFHAAMFSSICLFKHGSFHRRFHLAVMLCGWGRCLPCITVGLGTLFRKLSFSQSARSVLAVSYRREAVMDAVGVSEEPMERRKAPRREVFTAALPFMPWLPPGWLVWAQTGVRRDFRFLTFGFQRQRLWSLLYFFTRSFGHPNIFPCVPRVLLRSGTVVNGRWRPREALFSRNLAGIGRWLRAPRDAR